MLYVAELPILKRLSITSGLLISRQHIEVNKVNTTSENETGKSRFRGVLTAFEVPLNLKYDTFKRKNKEIAVSAGVSSLAYVKEDFSDEPASTKKRLLSFQ